MAPMEPPRSKFLLYDVTLTLHRLSPLHFVGSGSLFTVNNLAAHAKRFGDALKGDALWSAAIVSDMTDDALRRSGLVKVCRWTLLGSKPLASDSIDELHDADGYGTTRGIQVEIEYENCSYFAWMLNSAGSPNESGAKFVHLPLLALRMPNPLKELFLGYLASAFDARIDILNISSAEVLKMLELYIEVCTGHSDRALVEVVKDVQLSFNFRAPVSAKLRSLDMTIKQEDVFKFVKEGEGLRPSQSSTTDTEGPFVTAIARYLKTHLAMDISHKEVLIGRVACGGFALGREGKVKIFSPRFDDDDQRLYVASKEATQCLLSRLLDLAGSNGDADEA